MGEKQGSINFYMLTFVQEDSHSVRVYLNPNTFVPMRYNPKDSDVRKVIFKVPDELHEDFLERLKILTESQRRKIKISKVMDVFCNGCGCKYEYRMDNRTGDKICGECGGIEFIK